MEWSPNPSSALMVIRLRWSVVVIAPFLIRLSPLPFDSFFLAVLLLFAAGTAIIHMLYARDRGRGRLGHSLWLATFTLDLLLITAVIYFRVGISADVYNLYYLAIVQSALLFGMTEALSAAIGSSALYILAISMVAEHPTDLRRAVIRAIYMTLIGTAAAYLATSEKKALLMSMTDFKTRLPNFRHFHQVLQQAVSDRRRSGLPMTVAILDCDNFKALNAVIGHPGADQVLEQLADLLTRHKRGSDMLARYGGEEFVMFLPGVGQEQALAVLERFRILVAEHPFRVDGLHEPVYITVSVGGALLPDDAGTERELLVWADAALHTAKQAGKNRCSLSDRHGQTQVV